MTDHIERSIDIAAPIPKVWAALTDHIQFGEWFGASIDTPFRLGEVSRGKIHCMPGKTVPWEATVTAIEPQTRFAYTWHPFAVDPEIDYTAETPTLVEFTLKPIDTGTRLIVRESGFEGVLASRRGEAIRMNTDGWRVQIGNIARYAEANAAEGQEANATGTD
ncbi:SRPBCC family protein [Rhodobacteraceae bacterium DSL-40]|uniref:SRPBCC family protein n=1 Tax=Amaricoccus sp. B4 TaxID=3368557 RepID=UPI000DAB5091